MEPEVRFPEVGIRQTKLIKVKMFGVTAWISYETMVAFQVDGFDLVVAQNIWSRTTGRHLNSIDGGNTGSRVDMETFARKWSEQTLRKVYGY